MAKNVRDTLNEFVGGLNGLAETNGEMLTSCNLSD